MAKNNRLKKKIVKSYPALENVYGENLKNVSFKKDRNFRGIEYYDKNLPEYSDAYPFHPNPGNYGIRYNPKKIRKNGNKFEAISGDLLHGMHNDPEYNDLYSDFQKATLESYGENMDYWWDKQEDKTDGKDSFIRNEVDGRIRQLIQPNDKEHTIFMNEMTPNMTKAGNKILDYLKTNQKKYGGQVKYYAKGGWPYTGSYYTSQFEEEDQDKQDKIDISNTLNPDYGKTELILPNQTNQTNHYQWDLGYQEQDYQEPQQSFEFNYADKDFANYFEKANSNKSQSASRPNSLKNMKGMEAAGEIPAGSVASAKAGIAGAAFNAVGTGLESLAPPDSKFGKAMQKGNSFAKTAEPLKMLDMAVPGLGTGLTAGASLIGAIVGAVQAKNEEIDTKRIEDNTNFLKKYQNFNFDKVSQGNRMAEEGYNVQGSDDQLIQEIFQDFDNLLGIQSPQMRYGGKLYANEGFNVPNNYTAFSGTRETPSYVPPSISGIQGKSPEQSREIANYMDFDQSELYQFKDNDSLKELIPINTPGYTASRVNPIYRKMPNSRQYIPLSKQQYSRGLSFLE